MRFLAYNLEKTDLAVVGGCLVKKIILFVCKNMLKPLKRCFLDFSAVPRK
jgi:hypothetical protein